MSPQVAVIVPVYKVEEYLHQCIDSILNQTYPHLKVILVDDGSPDRCGAICEEYAQQDPRVLVIHKENGGLSSARNVGLLHVAECEYLTYVDSDDWIEPDFIRQAISTFSATPGIDIVQAPFVYCDMTGDKIPGAESLPSQTSDRSEVLRLYTRLGYIDNHVWGKVYRMETVRGILFQEGVNMEDIGYTIQSFLRISSCAWLDAPMYNYRIGRAGSIMEETNPIESLSIILTNLADLLSRPSFDREAQGWINTLLYNHLYRAWVILHRSYAGKSAEDYERVREFFLHWAKFSHQYPYYNVYAGKGRLRGELQRLVHSHPKTYLRIYELLKGK